ncbi:MAG: MSCRAMM family protein, partial [Blastocatellia bacterium]
MKLTSTSRVLDLMRIAGALRAPCLLAAIWLSCSVLAVAQTAPSQVSPGTISGKVTLSGKPVGGIKVILMSEESGGPQSGSVAARAKTDDSGLYSFGELSPGRYSVIPVAPADVLQGDTMNFQEGKPISLDSGEQASGVDLSLQPGAVISGRVVDAANQPISGQHVMLEKLDGSGKAVSYWSIRAFNIATDDRGIYRAYGVPAGRYKVSVGGDQSPVNGPVHFAKTYSPGVTDPATANIVEVQGGAESLNVDISLGAGSKTYSVSGRFVESDTGLAIPYVGYGYGRQPGGYIGNTGNATDSKGQFKLEGLAPGHYQVLVSQDDATGYVAESNEFDVTDSDVSGLEVKASRGSSVSGTITLENSNADPSVAAGISGLTFFAFIIPTQGGMVAFKSITPAADGTFQLTGLTAGSLRLQLRNAASDPSGYRLA